MPGAYLLSLSKYIVKVRLFDTTQVNMGLVPQALLGLAKFLAQVPEILTTKVLQAHPFQVVPVKAV